MFFTKHKQLARWLIIGISFVILSLVLWNTYAFFQKFKADERAKMSNWTFAYAEFAKNIENMDVNSTNIEINLVAERLVVDTTMTTPMLLLDSKQNVISYRNIRRYNKNEDALSDKLDSIYVHKNLNKLIARFSNENQPLLLNNKILYYGISPLLNKLKYYPLALLLIVFLFTTVIFLFYKTNKNAIQNKLWTGMAKETAHQIGTPLSSLIGWTEILKLEKVNPEYITEIEKDISRLETITERFSKIGSIPTLEKADIVEETKASYDYLKTRSSKLINFNIEVPSHSIYVNLNKQLFSWTIENLVKNAIDAMKGRGDLTIRITELEHRVKMDVIDTGKGISKGNFNTIFEPGYTSKKRGWGLGLSLAKRIIEDFHGGKIKVLKSEIGKGTTLQVQLKAL
jgi:signal transduction histidine kinase